MPHHSDNEVDFADDEFHQADVDFDDCHENENDMDISNTRPSYSQPQHGDHDVMSSHSDNDIDSEQQDIDKIDDVFGDGPQIPHGSTAGEVNDDTDELYEQMASQVPHDDMLQAMYHWNHKRFFLMTHVTAPSPQPISSFDSMEGLESAEIVPSTPQQENHPHP